MFFLSLFIFIFISSSYLFPFLNVSELSNNLHRLCLTQLNFETPLADLYKALVCGKRLASNSPLKELFVKGGLIHLTVVSGAHLLFIEKLWEKLPLKTGLKTYGLFVFLILYAFASHLHPPVVRALFAFFLFRLSHSSKLFWNASFVTLLSGIFCLIYKVSWVHSFSLQLSLLACFLQTLSKSSIKKCFFIYLFIFPIVSQWQSLHPITIFINWIVAPLISGLLFPLSFLSPFFPILYPISDFLWTFCLQLLKFVQFLPSESFFLKWSLSKIWIWPYIGFVALTIFIINFLKKWFFLYPNKIFKPDFT